MAGVLISHPMVLDTSAAGVVLAIGLLVVVGVLDDMRGTPVAVRLVTQFAAAGLFFVSLGPSGFLAVSSNVFQCILHLAALCFLVWMVNMYNFMDGIDGIAGGMGVIGFSALGVLGWIANALPFSALSFIIAASAAGFLFFNFPPARIFLGDVGSSVLGFFAGALILWGTELRVFPLWIGLLVFSPFLVDSSLTLLRRFIAGEQVWAAHRSHYYQRLVRLGWRHRRVTLAEYGLMFVVAVTSIALVNSPLLVQWLVIALFGAIYALVVLLIGRMERHAGIC